jgi:phage terminase large subunit GpA-like protein
VLYVYPDELTAKENSRDRILPMIQSSVRLREYLTGIEDDKGVLRISLRHMPVYFAWASSPARLGNKPIRHLVFDEVDKYPDAGGGKEADPISLGEKRTNTYRWGRKIWKISTPTMESGNIWKALTVEAQARFDYWVVCPLCGHKQRMFFEAIKWPEEERNAEKVQAEALAWYECTGCRGRWDDHLRNRAVAAGHWCEHGTGEELFLHLKLNKVKKIGFHLPAWLSPFVSLSECAAAFLKGLEDKLKLRDFKNGYAAEPWKDHFVTQAASDILAARTTIEPLTVPPEAVALTLSIDNQKESKWFAVRAWARDMTSWLVHFGQIFTFDELTDFIRDTTYPVEGSAEVKTWWRIGIDTGGGKKYEDMSMTEECYDWIASMRALGIRVAALKGASRPIPEGILRVGQPLNRTPSGKPIPFGMRIVSLETSKIKDMFFARLASAIAGEPRGAYLHAGTEEYYYTYIRQITAERKCEDEDGNIYWERVRDENHLLDCECGGFAMANPLWPGGGVNLLRPAGEQPQQQQADRGKKTWIGNIKTNNQGWVRR